MLIETIYNRCIRIYTLLFDFAQMFFDWMFTTTTIDLPLGLGGTIEIAPFDFFITFFITLLFVRVILALNS